MTKITLASNVKDVIISSPQNGDALVYSGGYFRNTTMPGGGDMLKSTYDTDNDGIVDSAESVPWSGITGTPATFPPSAHTHALDDLSDVSTSAPTSGQVLTWDTSNWVPRTPTASSGVGGGHTIQEEGSNLPQRTYLNFVGTGVTAVDDSGNDRTNVTITVSGGTAAHASTHENGGSDEISVSGLSGVLADRQDANKLMGVDVNSFGIDTGYALILNVEGSFPDYVKTIATGPAIPADHTHIASEVSVYVNTLSGWLGGHPLGLSSQQAFEILDQLPSGIVQDEGVNLPRRNFLNFIGSSITVVDDPANNRTNVTVTVSGTTASGGGHTIRDEGVSLPQRTYLNFVGDGVTVSDNGSDTTTVTIPGGTTVVSGNAGLYVSHIYGEDVTGSTHFDTVRTFLANSLRVSVNGLRQDSSTYVVDEDGSGFTTTFTVASGDFIEVDYDYVNTSGISTSGLFMVEKEGAPVDGLYPIINFLDSNITVAGNGSNNSVDVTLPNDGWIDSGETWTYASATTFTVAGNKTSIYTSGLKIKLTNSTVKYFYVVSSSYGAPNTTVTITGGSDYSLANSAISANYYSRVETPLGFPDTFNFTPVWTTTGTAPSIGDGTLKSHFKLIGKKVIWTFYFLAGASTTFGTGNWNFSIPLTASSYKAWNGQAYIRDAGTANYIRVTQIAAGGSVIAFFISWAEGTNDSAISNTVPMTWANGDNMNIAEYIYEIP